MTKNNVGCLPNINIPAGITYFHYTFYFILYAYTPIYIIYIISVLYSTARQRIKTVKSAHSIIFQ